MYLASHPGITPNSPFASHPLRKCPMQGRLRAYPAWSVPPQFQRNVRPRAEHTPGNQGGSAPKPRKGRDKQKEELQELLIDPTYDPLFDGIADEESGFRSEQDPFQAPKARRKQQQRRKSGRPVGTARVNFNTADESSEDYLNRRRMEREGQDGDEDDELALLLVHGEADEEEDEEEDDEETVFEYQLRCLRQAYLEREQEEVMELHHKHRATEVSSYAQATALAGVMDYYERQDEMSEDLDPLPSWIRAKKAIAHNWDVMEKLAGSRKETVKNLREFFSMTEERQHLLDTWDESLYAGEKDPEEEKPDYMDQFLVPSSLETDSSPSVQPTAEDWSRGIMPDLADDFDDEA